MPSFDIVSEVNTHELTNSIDQANREVSTRFDFKGVDASFTLDETSIQMKTQSDFQIKQMYTILLSKLSKRSIDLKSLDPQSIEASGREARQQILLKQGISKEEAKKIIKLLKDKKLKVQASIHDDKVRVTGKKKDELQNTMSLLKETEMDLPLQFNNFRD